MSTPSEEISAIQRAGQFLTRLMLYEPRIPKHVREDARSILRHYPGPTAAQLFWKREDQRMSDKKKPEEVAYLMTRDGLVVAVILDS